MQKIALFMEVPTAHLDDLSLVLDGHFVIASRCLSHPEYLKWYEQNAGKVRVMLDNGTHEDRKPVSVLELYTLAERVQPDVVFAPDILYDADETLRLSHQFMDLSDRHNAPWQVAIVPQGKDLNSLLRCYEEAWDLLQGDGLIGLSLMDNRSEFVDGIIEKYGGLLNCPHHMLGLRTLTEIPDWPEGIVSMDTVKPLKAAYHRLNLEDCPRGLGVWDTSWKLDDAQMGRCYRNIARLHQALTR